MKAGAVACWKATVHACCMLRLLLLPPNPAPACCLRCINRLPCLRTPRTSSLVSHRMAVAGARRSSSEMAEEVRPLAADSRYLPAGRHGAEWAALRAWAIRLRHTNWRAWPMLMGEGTCTEAEQFDSMGWPQGTCMPMRQRPFVYSRTQAHKGDE